MPADGVVVWRIPLDTDEAAVRAALDGLTGPERDRAGRFRRPRDGRRWAVARAGLREVLGRALGRDPSAVELEARPGTKPVLAGGDDSLHFSLSHSGDLALVALSRRAPVGVDCERIRELSDLTALTRRVFAPAERERWLRTPEPGRLRAFFEQWTCKESVVKATGDGLAVALDRVEIDVGPDGRPRLRGYPALDPGSPAWTLFRLGLGPSWAGAVTVLAEVAECRLRRLDSPESLSTGSPGDRSRRTASRRTRS